MKLQPPFSCLDRLSKIPTHTHSIAIAALTSFTLGIGWGVWF